MKCKNLQKQKFRICFIDIGLKNVAVAATRVVVGGLPFAVKKGVSLVDVYKTHAKLIIFGRRVQVRLRLPYLIFKSAKPTPSNICSGNHK